MKVGDFIEETGGGTRDYGVIIACGRVSYDVIWVGGSTSRYRHSDGRHVAVIDPSNVDDFTRRHLLGEAADARAERARGARIRRGAVSPS